MIFLLLCSNCSNCVVTAFIGQLLRLNEPPDSILCICSNCSNYFYNNNINK